jgi:hypothetical protein
MPLRGKNVNTDRHITTDPLGEYPRCPAALLKKAERSVLPLQKTAWLFTEKLTKSGE